MGMAAELSLDKRKSSGYNQTRAVFCHGPARTGGDICLHQFRTKRGRYYGIWGIAAGTEAEGEYQGL